MVKFNQLSKKTKIGAGIAGVVVVAGLAFAPTYFSNQNQFLMRLGETAKAQKVGYDFDLEINKYGNSQVDLAEQLDGLSGTVQTDGKNLHLETEFLDEAFEAVQYDEKLYVSAESFLSFYNISASITDDSADLDFSAVKKDYKDTYIDVVDFLRENFSDEVADSIEDALKTKTVDQNENKKLNKEIGEYLKKLDQSKYSKEGDFYYLTLDEDDFKGLVKISLENLVARDSIDKQSKKTYKKFLDDYDKNYDELFKNIRDFEIRIGLGAKPADMEVSLQMESRPSDSLETEIDLTFSTSQVAYKAPSKPDDIMDDSHYKDFVSDIQSAIWGSSDGSSYSSYADDDYSNLSDDEQVVQDYLDDLDLISSSFSESSDLDSLKSYVSDQSAIDLYNKHLTEAVKIGAEGDAYYYVFISTDSDPSDDGDGKVSVTYTLNVSTEDTDTYETHTAVFTVKNGKITKMTDKVTED